MKRYAIGADIGGSHISCALFDLFDLKIIDATRIEMGINNKAEASEILGNWAQIISEVLNKINLIDLEGIAFAMPGPFNYSDGIALFDKQVDKFEKLYGINVREEISTRLEIDVPIRFINDAVAFAVGESWVGVAQNTNKNVALTLGTGFGSAFIHNGLPAVEGKGVPKQGCVWHLPFKESISDDYFSTRWFQSRWKEMTGEKIVGAKCIVDKFNTDENAQKIFDEYGTNMATFIGPWLKDFSADTLILGGNISRAYTYFKTNFENNLQKQGVNTKIAISKLKEDASIIGCCRLLLQNYYNKIETILPKIS